MKSSCSIAALLMLLFSVPVAADVPEMLLGDVTIRNVRLTAAEQGGNSRLEFEIVNERRDGIVLLGAASALASGSRLRARTDAHTVVDLDSYAVRPQDVLRLDSSHLWVELPNVTRTLHDGEELALTIRFLRADFPAVAHVHDDTLSRCSTRGPIQGGVRSAARLQC